MHLSLFAFSTPWGIFALSVFLNSILKSIRSFLILCLLLFSTSISNAQPVINLSIVPKPGSSAVFAGCDSTAFLPGSSGANQIWDFTYLKPIDTTRLYYMKPDETPYASFYPEANVAMTADNLVFDYFNFSDEAYYSLGSMGYNADNGTSKMTRYGKPEQVLRFPLINGVDFESKNTRTSLYIGRFRVDQHIESRSVVDGYGTLMLPGMTYKDAVRTVQTAEWRDSISKDGRFMLQIQSELKYQWFVNGVSAPLLTISKDIQLYKGDTFEQTDHQMAMGGYDSAFLQKTLPFGVRIAQNEAGYQLNAYLKQAGTITIDILDAEGDMRMPPKSVHCLTTDLQVLFSASELFGDQPYGLYHFRIRGHDFETSVYMIHHPEIDHN